MKTQWIRFYVSSFVSIVVFCTISFAQNKNGNLYEKTASDDIEIISNNNLRLKDRRATKNNLGYVYQQATSDFTKLCKESNTIYEIRYRIDLNQKTVILPDNVTLFFNGGSICNGTLVFKNTKLLGLVNLDVDTRGYLAESDYYAEWFGMVANDVSKASTNYKAIRRCLLLALASNPRSYRESGYGTMHLPSGRYFVSGNNPLWITLDDFKIIGGDYDSMNRRAGLTVKGAGKGATILVMHNTTGKDMWFGSNEMQSLIGKNYNPFTSVEGSSPSNGTSVMDNVTFSGITFTSDADKSNTTSKSNCSGFYFRTYGKEKFNLWENCEFSNLDYVIAITGYGNGDHNRFFDCNVTGIRESMWFINNNQSVDNTVVGGSIHTYKDVVQIGPSGGGDMTLEGISVELYAPVKNGKNVDASGYIIHKLSSSHNKGVGSGLGNGLFTLNHIRLESYGSEKGLYHCDTASPYGQVMLKADGCSFVILKGHNGASSKPHSTSFVNIEGITSTIILSSCGISSAASFDIKNSDDLSHSSILFDRCLYTIDEGYSFRTIPHLLKDRCSTIGTYNSISCQNLIYNRMMDSEAITVVGQDFTMGSPLFPAEFTIRKEIDYNTINSKYEFLRFPKGCVIQSIGVYKNSVDDIKKSEQRLLLIAGPEKVVNTGVKLDDALSFSSNNVLDQPIIVESNFLDINLRMASAPKKSKRSNKLVVVIRYTNI